MKLTNNWRKGHRSPNSHLLYLNQASGTGIVLHLIALLAKGNPQTTQAVSKAICFFLQTDGKPLLLKTMPTQTIKCEEI